MTLASAANHPAIILGVGVVLGSLVFYLGLRAGKSQR